MKYFYSLVACAVLFGTITFPSSTFAATNTTDSLSARLQALMVQIRQLEIDLARVRALETTTTTWCYQDGRATTNCSASYPYSIGNLERVEADIEDNFSRVYIKYTNGRSKNLIFNANTQDEVVDYLMDETGASRAHILSVVRFYNISHDDSEDIDQITATITEDDTYVEVEFENNNTERFTLHNETNKEDIIEIVADRLNEDEDDIEDIIRFRYDSSDADEDVDSIEVTIDRNDDESVARVRYEDGTRDTFSYNTDDKDDIVSSLADDLDLRESEVEDLVEYEYR